uniref:uncharacterized protein C3orf67 homolog isoform X5 n=1 Tax=Scatophagus argus TaxID=75038 RepID=UPI001ED7FDDD|nr:uncharacterized protein C3orf67 homolog isoform X5 [Scatophagus argus]
MFRNNYQGGAVVEVFSGQGKDPVANWKLSGGPSAIHKEYHKEVKGFVYCLEGSSQTVKMQMPENGKLSLGLLQRFLVLQVNIPQCKDFSVELVVTDLEHLKRRLHLSTVHKEVSATPLHAKIPFGGLKRNIWSALCIDLVSFTGELFKGFLSLDLITLFASCKVRRIFTMKTEPTGLSDDDVFLSGAGLMDLIPRSCRFPPDVSHVTLVLNMDNLQRTGLLNSDYGTPFNLRPQPPKDRVADRRGSKKLRVYSSGRERLASTDEYSWSPVKESSQASPTAESLSCSIWPGLSCDLQVCSSWENNEGSEPQLTLQEEMFTFLSQPHSPKRGQGQGDQEKIEMGNYQVQSKSGRRHEAPLEDDFFGSESDEDKTCTMLQNHRPSVESNSAAPRSPSPSLEVQLETHSDSHIMDQTAPKGLSPDIRLQSPSSGKAEPAGIVPTRCLSPSVTPSRQEHKYGQCDPRVVNQVVQGNSIISLSRRLLQEVRLDDFTQHKEEDDTPLKPVDSRDYNLHLHSSLHVEDDEELRMLASLKREQEEDECRASGLNTSQIHQCNVSISMSSDDTSTWTHISMPANQGHHYQKEMNPLLQSNPREWMDVLSPPIMPPSQQRRSGSTWNNRENLIGGGDEMVNEEEDEYLNLLYDPCLNCYFDPNTGKYYELA